jgi:hypothetical protein
MNTLKYDPYDFQGIFQKYNSKAKNKDGYDKMDYTHWRKLRDLIYDSNLKRVELSNYSDKEIRITFCEELSFRDEFLRKDSEFGRFLYWEYLLPQSCKKNTVDLETIIANYDPPIKMQTPDPGATLSASTGGQCNWVNTATGTAGVYSLGDWSQEYQTSFNSSDLDITFSTNKAVISVNELSDSLKEMSESINELQKAMKENIIFEDRKEEKEMKGFNFDFGSCEGSNVRMSMYGMAVKNASGIWVAYDKENEQIMDVDILNFEGSKYMYKMPVALKDVAKGDVVIHNRRPMFVTGVTSGKITAIDPFEGEEKVVLLTKSPFGFDFATKVVCLFDGAFGKADAANPFGNMLPFLMMGDSDIDPMMLMAMSGNMDMSNPMMMYMLMKDGGNSDLLPFLMMGGFGKTCSCHCDKE